MKPADSIDVVLASASPRRRELLARLGVEATVWPTAIDERVLPGELAADHVRRLAEAKANALFTPGAGPPGIDGALVVGADTVVEVDGDILGKPADADEARAMLGRLSGRSHRVLTGVSVRRGDRVSSGVDITDVRFRALTDIEIEAYVAGGEPMDKAGAYAVQGGAGLFVTGIAGSDTNVIGLPLALLGELTAEVGVDLVPSVGARRRDPDGFVLE